MALCVAGACMVAVPALVAAAGPVTGTLVSEDKLDPVYGQGVARSGDGWILSGRNVLGTLDDELHETKRAPDVIPPEWAARGFDHVGDPDVYGDYLYAPLEQPDYEKGEQAVAWFDPETLEFVDAMTVAQHENSFLTIDDDGVAYTTDNFDDDTVLRYDVEDDWKPLEPLKLDQLVQRIQGADAGAGALWLSTDDAQNAIYRVDLDSGAVALVASMGHLDGEGEGIDVTALPTGLLHTLTVDVKVSPVWFGHFAVPAGTTERTDPPGTGDDGGTGSTWPPILVVGAAALAVVGSFALFAVFRQARASVGRGEGRS